MGWGRDVVQGVCSTGVLVYREAGEQGQAGGCAAAARTGSSSDNSSWWGRAVVGLYKGGGGCDAGGFVLQPASAVGCSSATGRRRCLHVCKDIDGPLYL